MFVYLDFIMFCLCSKENFDGPNRIPPIHQNTGRYLEITVERMVALKP